MARPAPTIPVSPKMYRHFAIITVSITGCLALFADGEGREAIQQEIASRQQQNEMRQAEQELAAKGKGGNTVREVFRDKRRVKGTFGADPGMPGVNDVGYGGSMGPELGVGEAVSFEAQPADTDEAAMLPQNLPPGMTMEEWLALKKRNQTHQSRMPKPRDITQADRNRMFEESLSRVNTRD